ncbi:unnamed protein product [Protopolystoma xenopodis]|uniref:Uncharacterized protein n=1 Tax=Protopolystoma xenopodis TaxID=117903 RepID=A0A3S4ZZ68_9PLAT|nr:unnamed protein product [Protopolystoma xenopodis]
MSPAPLRRHQTGVSEVGIKPSLDFVLVHLVYKLGCDAAGSKARGWTTSSLSMLLCPGVQRSGIVSF